MIPVCPLCNNICPQTAFKYEVNNRYLRYTCNCQGYKFRSSYLADILFDQEEVNHFFIHYYQMCFTFIAPGFDPNREPGWELFACTEEELNYDYNISYGKDIIKPEDALKMMYRIHKMKAFL